MRLLTIYNVVTLALLALVPQPTSAALLAIDYGAEWIKASVMGPGVPFDVLLNKDSKRKIQASVGWKRSDRLFGTDAYNLASRFPTDSFNHLKCLQAMPFTSSPVSFFGQISTAAYFQNERKSISFERSDSEQFSVEELIAMQFAYVKQLAETAANEKIADVIVTVPAFFTEFERNAVVDAIEIAGLRTLALVNDGTAVAVNYAVNRNFQPSENGTANTEWHVIYDAGASSVRATVVGFSAITDKKGAVTGTQIQVAGVGYDRNVGGLELDRRMRDLFVDRFATKWGKDIRGDTKGMAKLWKEAGRVKQILSANAEATANVESAAWDLDFKTKVTRAEFEAACSDLQDTFVTPLHDALTAAGMGINDITSVILFGGSSRVPMIQSALRSAVGEDKIAVNVNADEAAVLGAALHGASLSRQFKTKTIKVADIMPYDVSVSYFAASTNDATVRPRSITTNIFPAGTKTGTKKTLTFKRKEDFSINFDYKAPPVPGLPARIMEVDIQDVAEALANLTERGAVDPVVKATLSLSESGFLSVSEAIAFGEIKDESMTGKLKSFFGVGSGSSPTSSSEEEIQAENGASESASASSSSESSSESASTSAPASESASTSAPASESASETSSSASSASPSPTSAKKKRDPSDNTIVLTVKTKFTTIRPLSVEDKRESRNRLRAIDADEAAKMRKEEARNTFEGYLYKLRDLLDDEDETTPFKKCSTPNERKGIYEELEDSFLWLHDTGDIAETSQFLDKRIALETLERPIVHRYKEIEAFPQALNNSQMWNWSTRLFLAEARQNLTAEAEAGLPSKWTAEELDSLEKTLKEHESWLGEWVEKQKKVKSWEDPVIETTEMKARAKVLEQHLHKLWKRKTPKIKKKTTSTNTTTATETRTERAEATATDEGRQVPLGGDVHDEL